MVHIEGRQQEGYLDSQITNFVALALIILGAYTVFGMTGFGAAMVAMPMLVHFKPLAHAVPLMLLLDLAATATVGSRNWRSVALPELLRLIPCMLAGVILGVAALSYLDARPILLCLGIFIVCSVLWNMRAIDSNMIRAGTGWAVPSGVIGGIFGAAFGTGGPVYTLYLVRRIADMAAFRATIAAVILVSGLLRVAIFGATGLLSDRELVLSALTLVPFCLAGVFAGSALRHRISPQLIRRFVLAMLLAGGVAVIVRALRT